MCFLLFSSSKPLNSFAFYLKYDTIVVFKFPTLIYLEVMMTWILLGVVVLAYSLTWYFVLRSKKIIEKISNSEYKNSRDIINNLKL